MTKLFSYSDTETGRKFEVFLRTGAADSAKVWAKEDVVFGMYLAWSEGYRLGLKDGGRLVSEVYDRHDK